MAERSWAQIQFPAARMDEDLRDYLNREHEVEFSETGEVIREEGDREVWVNPDTGVFTLSDPQTAYGEFEELEDFLINKAIPFDRTSGQDWNRNPVLRIFRPEPDDIDKKCFTLAIDPDSYEPVVSVNEIRKILTADSGETDIGLMAYKKTIDLVAFLDKTCPPYAPLADYQKAMRAKVRRTWVEAGALYGVAWETETLDRLTDDLLLLIKAGKVAMVD